MLAAKLIVGEGFSAARDGWIESWRETVNE
jgi:hypothetical protein